MTAYVSTCGSDMQSISIFHLMALLHTPPAAMKDLWLEWLDVMVSSVLSGMPFMQLAFNPYLFLFSHGTGMMWWYDPLMRAIIL